MTYIVVDVETDGPIPGDYSMISLGAVMVEEGLKHTFYKEIKPISKKYEIKRLNFLKLSRQETLKQEEPIKVLKEFIQWIKKNSKDYPIFVSDNNGFDWMFVCWYLEHFIGKNPFGYNSMNLNSLYAGVTKQLNNNIKKIRKSLTHNALEDAKENAHILLTLIKSNNLKFPKGKS